MWGSRRSASWPGTSAGLPRWPKSKRSRRRVTAEHAARRLAGCDVVFGCTDDNAGRLVLSRLPTYYLTPVIDMGVLLSSDNGRLTGIDGRVTVVSPGSACLVCRGRIDLARAGSEQLPRR